MASLAVNQTHHFFTYHNNDKSLVLLLYVDDILLTGSDDSLMQDLLDSLNNPFAMKDLGTPSYFLGIEIESHKDSLFLHQTAYAEDILHQASMSLCNLMHTPLPTRLDELDKTPFSEPT